MKSSPCSLQLEKAHEVTKIQCNQNEKKKKNLRTLLKEIKALNMEKHLISMNQKT